MTNELPTKSRSFRLSDQDLDHMRRLRARLPGRSQTDVISLALTHLLATLEHSPDGRGVHLTVPSDEIQEETKE